jgi:branched-chain amino acid transport system ATP-binding protein
LLDVSNLRVKYGSISAVHGASMHLSDGKLVALIGPNGAGKSSILNAISGLTEVTSGSVRFEGREISGLRADQIVRLGIAQVPEGRYILNPLTVEENLLVGGHIRSAAENRARLEEMYRLFPILQQRRKQSAGLLSGGEQQMLAIARALMARPKLLMLDEPSLGLAPLVVQQVSAVLAGLRDRGTTMLLVEQNARLALELSSYAYVLENGLIVREGASEELRTDPAVIAAYLGGPVEA